MKRVIKEDESVLIASFACLGKTFFAKKHADIAIDIESIYYIYDHEILPANEESTKSSDLRAVNANFPDNYISDVVKNIGKFRFIFLTLSKEILSELDKMNIRYTILYPTKERCVQILEDSKKRGNKDDFIEMLGKMLSDDAHQNKFKNGLHYDAFEYISAGTYIEDYIRENYEYEG